MNEFVPYEVIVSAVAGDTEAILLVLKHYEGYIDKLSRRKMMLANGAITWMPDEDVKRELEIELITKLPRFNV